MTLIKRLVFASFSLGMIGYLVKGRELGLPLWTVILGFAVFSGAAMLLRALMGSGDGD